MLGVRYNPCSCLSALAAGLQLLRLSVSVLLVGAPLPFSTHPPGSRIERLLCRRQLPLARAQCKEEDSLPALLSSSGIGLSPCWGAAGWGKSTAPKILS